MPAPTVTKVVLLPGRNGVGSINGGNTEIHMYQVTFDVPTAFAQDAMHATDGVTAIPAARAALSRYPGLICQSVNPTQTKEDPRVWLVQVTYGPPQPQQKQEDPGDGSKFNVDISGTLVPFQENVTVDVSSPPKPLKNSAGDPFPDGLPVTGYDEQITVSYTVVAPAWTTIDQCKGKSNAEAITLTINGAARVFEIHTLKLENMTWSLVYTAAGKKVVKIDLVFMYRPDTWTAKITDMGFNRLDAGKRYVITTDDKPPQNKTSPTHLDGNGAVASVGSDAVQLSFENVKKTPFTALLAQIAA